jgi:lipoyl(octanoyl) transferase
MTNGPRVHAELPPLEIYLLGQVDFDEVQRLQRRLVYDLGERGGAVLLLCEHAPMISVGRAGSRAHILADDEELRGLGVPVRWVNRGGGCVFHGPGQLVGYLSLSLRELGLDVRRYVAALHQMLLGVLGEFDLRGSTRSDSAGVFLGGSRVGSVGVAIGRWISSHGFTLNVGAYLDPFRLVEEPASESDPRPVRSTTMEAWRQRPTPMAKVREVVIRQVEAAFRLDAHHLYTNHPLMPRKAPFDVFASSYR